jgi:hypothetical protein
MGGQQFLDPGNLRGGQAPQDISEIFLRVETPSPATPYHGVEDGTAPASLGMAQEEPAFAFMQVLP